MAVLPSQLFARYLMGCKPIPASPRVGAKSRRRSEFVAAASIPTVRKIHEFVALMEEKHNRRDSETQ
jgi:hypothetical protein